MKPHVHLTITHGIAVVLFVFAVFATLHILALNFPENPMSRVLIATGF